MLKKIAVLSLCSFISFSLALTIPVAGYQETVVKNGGVISGTVTFTGDIPKPKQLMVTKDQDVCTQEIFSEECLVSGSDRGIKNVVVWLEDIPEGKAWDALTNEPILDNKDCIFQPHVLVVRAGGNIKVINSDPVIHNMNTFPFNNKRITLTLLEKDKGTPISQKLEVPDVIKVICDAHRWMSAWIVVRDNPYYAVTDSSGKFTIKDIPPGEYTVQVWHELLGEETKQVKIEAKGMVTVNLEFSP